MARIRTVKPEFWSDEKLSPQSPIVRLVFLGLISMADDAGRLVDNVKAIDGFIFPESDESSRDSLVALASAGRIVRYISDSGQRLVQVANWLKHQKVDKPSRYVLPAPSGQSSESRESLAEVSRSDLGPTTNDLGPTTDDHGPSTAAAREQEARNELVALLGSDNVSTVDDFLEAAPASSRYAWARGLIAMLIPQGGLPMSHAALLIAMQDFLVADRVKWPFVGRVFRAFVDDANRPRRTAPPAARANASGRASMVLASIRLMIKTSQQPGQRAIQFIPKAEVQALGADVYRAYEAIGGAERVIGATGEQMGFLLRDFTQALEAARDAA